MLVDFFFNPFPYLPWTPSLNLKVLYSANWKSSFSSHPFPYLIYGACGVGEKCPTHWPFPRLLCVKIPYLPFSTCPFLFTHFLAKRSLFLPDPKSILHKGSCPVWTCPHSCFSCPLCSFAGALFLGGAWLIEQPWAFGDL